MVRTYTSVPVCDDSGTRVACVDITIDADAGTVQLSNVQPAPGVNPPPVPSAPIPYTLTPQASTDDVDGVPADTLQVQLFADGSLHVVGQKDLLWFRIDGGQSQPPPAPTGPVPPFTPCFRDSTGRLFTPDGSPLA